jgi:hypothetical protein
MNDEMAKGDGVKQGTKKSGKIYCRVKKEDSTIPLPRIPRSRALIQI